MKLKFKNDHKEAHREITPLNNNDCCMVFDRERKKFDFPVHFHPEYEINLILNASKAKRIAGDNVCFIGNVDLVMTGPNLIHGWEQGNCNVENVREVTIQFHKDLFPESLLNKNFMKPIKDLLTRSSQGIL